MKSKVNSKRATFNFFDYKWSLVPTWAKKTEGIYRQWYLSRYGYKNMQGLKKFLAKKMDICEAGCGLARDSKMFAEVAPHARILAVDQSPHALAGAKKTLAPFKNCETMRGDITSFKPGRMFDFISCDQVLHHTPHPDKTLAHFYSLVKPGGVINFSVCKKKNEYREVIDELIMRNAPSMKPKDLWVFAEKVTELAKAVHDLGIKNVKFGKTTYSNLQRYMHNHVFRAWYNPDLPFELSVSSNYDWFSGNPRYSESELRKKILGSIKNYTILHFNEDDAVFSVSLRKKN